MGPAVGREGEAVLEGLSRRVRRLAGRLRRAVDRRVDPVDHGTFVERFFDPDEYRGFVSEFERGPAHGVLEAARERYGRLVGDGGDFGALGPGADRDLEAFRAQTFEGYGGAAVPPGEEPGWIVPDELRDRWTLVLGRSRRELSRLLTGTDAIDLFLHDSEHSLPCMMFEFELAWEWLRPGGLILSDDIGWNEAFGRFADARAAERGRITRNVGYMVKA